MTVRHKKLAVLVAGGPAPGITSVIGALTIRAELAGVEVVGLHDGFHWVMEGNIDHVSRLTTQDVSRIHFRGGSHIGISRANPTRHENHLEATMLSLLRLDVDKLVTIGGDDTAYSAYKLGERAQGSLRVVHVPKTIDNDLDLPGDVFTFGFQTARHVGAEIIKNLMVDAKTTHRWYFVVAMGRKAGHLALGIGKAAGATLTLIPEEFKGNKIKLDVVADTLVGAIVKRLSYGRPDGVAVLAEGLVERMDASDLADLVHAERDAHDNLRIAEVNLGEVLKVRVQQHLRAYGIKTTVAAKNIGYELRCTDPIPLDMEYTRDLGYCAARYIIEGGTGAMVSIQDGRFVPIPFSRILDPTTGRARVRMVDVDSDRYRIARSYMLRLRREDFTDANELARFAATVGLSIEEFRAKYSYLVEDEPTPRSLVPPPMQVP